MKRLICTLLVLTLTVAVLSACMPSAFLPSDTDSSAAESIAEESSAVSYIEESRVYYDDADFQSLRGMTFWFMSGAGAWRTYLQIQPDGSFVGYYSDDDAGYRAECQFSGKFTSLKKVAPYEYTMKCESLETKGTLGEERTEKTGDYDTIVTIVEPYGLKKADLFHLYLPGKSLDELPLDFKQWGYGIPWKDPEELDDERYSSAIAEYGTVLKTYGIYNASGFYGFFAEERY